MNGIVSTHTHTQIDDPRALRLLVETAVLDLGVRLSFVERDELHGGGGSGGVVVGVGDLASADVGDGHAEGNSGESGRRHCKVRVKQGVKVRMCNASGGVNAGSWEDR